MSDADHPTPRSMRFAGRCISGLVVAFLLFDSAIKLADLPVVGETLEGLGYDRTLSQPLGVLTLGATLLYGLPRTAVLGAIVLTGLFGGAMATHLRAGSPIFSHLLFGLYLGVLTWAGLYLRDARLRRLLPIRA